MPKTKTIIIDQEALEPWAAEIDLIDAVTIAHKVPGRVQMRAGVNRGSELAQRVPIASLHVAVAHQADRRIAGPHGQVIGEGERDVIDGHVISLLKGD